MPSVRVPILVGLALASAAMSACGAPGSTASSGASRASASITVTATEATSPVQPERVELAGGDTFTWRMAVAPDGQTALVGQSSEFFPTSRQSRIDEIRRQSDGSWSQGTRVEFSTESSADLDPFFTADGSRVWFSSIRDIDGAERPDTDLWYVDRGPDGAYGDPVNAGPAINSPAEDLYPTIASDGTLYLGSDRGGDGFDIWSVTSLPQGGWAAPERLPAPVTSSAWEFNPALTSDSARLVFTALNRPGGPGLGDIWFTTTEGITWTEPELLSTVNSARDEYHASFSADGATMFFVRDGSLYQIATSAIWPSAN